MQNIVRLDLLSNKSGICNCIECGCFVWFSLSLVFQFCFDWYIMNFISLNFGFCVRTVIVWKSVDAWRDKSVFFLLQQLTVFRGTMQWASTARFLNNHHLVLKINRLESHMIWTNYLGTNKPKGRNRLAEISQGYLWLREMNLSFNEYVI